MSTPDPALWRDMLAHLRRHHGEICRQWFEELEPLWFDGGLLQIRVNNTIQQNYLARHCTEHFNEAIQAATGALVAVAFVNGDTVAPAKPAPAKPAKSAETTAQKDEQERKATDKVASDHDYDHCFYIPDQDTIDG